MIVYPGESKSSYEKFFGKEVPYARCLQSFGKIGIIKNHEKIRGKLTNRGKVTMFIGYPKSSSKETFKFLNLKTMRKVLIRDIIWMNRSYGSCKGLASITPTLMNNDDNENEENEKEKDEEIGNEVDNDEKDNDEEDDYDEDEEEALHKINNTANQKQRTMQALKKLQFTSGEGNPKADRELSKLAN